MDPYRLDNNQIQQNQMVSPIQEMVPQYIPEQNTFAPTPQIHKNNANYSSCLVGLIPLILLIIFIFFGGQIFGFFHIENIYHFIISIFVILIIYIIALFVVGITIQSPKDLLTIAFNRYSKKK